MKINIGWVCVIAFLLMAGLAGGAKARNDGQYIAWTVEEFNGWSWMELNARAGDQATGTRCEQYNKRSRPGNCEDSYSKKDKDPRSGVDSTTFREFRIQPTLGKKYRIKITNLTQCRLAVTVDVDGKNSINSRDVSGTSADAAWVLDRNATIDVSGFQSGLSTAMEFYWTDREDAHSDRAAKLGAIKMYVYFENGSCARDTIEHTNDSPRGGRSLAREQPGATGAGNEVFNPVHKVNFNSYSRYPLEKVSIVYDHRSSAPVRHSDYGRKTYSVSSNCYTGVGVEGNASGYTGVYLNKVFPHKPAWNVGIRAGDRIVKVNGKNVNGTSEMTDILRRMSPGDYVDIKYVHNGKAMTSGVLLDTICP
jgi:hypothetical protein